MNSDPVGSERKNMARKPTWKESLPRLLVVLHDLAMVVVSWLGLYWLANLAGAPAASHWLTRLSLVLAVQGMVFWKMGLYRGVWRFASMPDLINIAAAAFVGMPLPY